MNQIRPTYEAYLILNLFLITFESFVKNGTLLLTNLKTLASSHQDHMIGMHQKSMFCPFL